jgi:DNA helicase-2/ATP-dependent DNA helicase PcrA
VVGQEPDSSDRLLQGLNDRQREAVLHSGSPLLILAGAGSGKTRVITTKIAHLLQHKEVRPQQVLAVTFTNKAAAQMRTRLDVLLGERGDASKLMIRTFHAFGLWLLRVHGQHAGLDTRRLSVYDDADSVQLLRGFVDSGYQAADLREMAAWIADAKNRGLLPSDDLSSMRRSPFEMEEIYTRYQGRLATVGAVDFGDLIVGAVALLRDYQEVRKRVRDRFRIIMVDEFQDANPAQFDLLQALHGRLNYLCVVGDDDQSIYRFRGADVDSFLAFPTQISNTQVIRLEQNYRSTGAVLDLASAVVAHNRRRMGKTLWTTQEQGQLPTLAFLDDQDAEAQYCADLLKDRQYASTAILYRMNFQSRAFETLFQGRRIPYRIVGTVRFYEREEVRDAVAYLALINNPRDEIAFRRAASKPRRGIGNKTLDQVAAAGAVADAGGDLLVAAREVAAASKGAAARSLGEFVALIEEVVADLEAASIAELIRSILERSGLYDLYVRQDQAERSGRVQNLEELVSSAHAYGAGAAGLAAFLEDARLAPGNEQQGGTTDGSATPGDLGAVTLITVHNTKGLEFDRVIVTGLEDGIFPASEPGAPGVLVSDEDEEEERRLFYVAVTRARYQLHLTSCRRRLSFGAWRPREPSRFIAEIPEECVVAVGVEDQEGGGMAVGQGVYHDDYGQGVVARRWLNEGETLLEVRFATGRAATFIARYADLDPIADD